MHRRTTLVVAAMSVMFLMSTGLVAQGVCAEKLGGEVAKQYYEPDEIYWQPLVEYERIVLRVDAPCDTVEKVFERGEQVAFGLNEVLGPVDGSYSWELRVEPVVDAEVREALTKAHETGDDSIVKKLQDQGKLPTGPFVEREAFSVVEGRIVPPGSVEEKAQLVARSPAAALGGLVAPTTGAELVQRGDDRLQPKDYTHYDDVIITGSLCVGFDCVNGESFGYDTIRLKENNLRIGFNDTSTGSFPTGNWQIRANDATSGGASYMAIVDMGADGEGSNDGDVVFAVESGAPSGALYVDDYGRVGLGTKIPYVELHIVDGDTPTVRLDQDGSSGFASQRWDVAGNETNFFIRDVTNGSTLPFRMQPGAPSSSLSIRNDGDVGIGTWAPDADLHVIQTNSTAGFHLERNGSPVMMLFEDSSAGQEWEFKINAGGDFAINDPDSPNGEFILNPAGDLSIEGDFISNGTTLNVPDYVFDPGYGLMALDELQSFVATHKHLPGIPSKAEIGERRQVNLSNLQMRLLEKIEELTLYTLDQQQHISGLESELEEREEVIRQLAAEVAELKEGVERLQARR